MSPRTPIFLAAMCLVLAGLWGWLDRTRPPPERESAAALFTMRTSDVVRVSVRWPDAAAEVSRSADGSWSLLDAKGSPVRADASLLRAALAELELLGRGGRVEGAAPSFENGLSPPRLEVEVFDARGSSARITFGGGDGRDRVYAAREGAVYVVAARARDAFGRRPRDLEDDHVFYGDPRRFERAQVGDVRIERREGRLFASPPDGALADADVAREVVARLRSLRRDALAPRNAGAKATVRAEVVLGGAPQVAHLDRGAPSVRALLASTARAVTLRPLELRAALLDRVEIDDGRATLVMIRKVADDAWRIVAGGADFASATIADDERVRALIGGVHTVTARAVLPALAASAVAPVERRLRFFGGGDPVVVEVGPVHTGASTRHVRLAGVGAVYVVDDAPWARAGTRALDWRRRVLWDLPPASIEAVALGETELRRDERFRWRHRSGRGAPWRELGADENAAVEALVRRLGAPPVARFESTAVAPRTSPLRSLVLETIDGEKRTRHEAQVGPDTPEGPFVFVGSVAAIFDRTLWQDLRRVLGPSAQMRAK